MSDAQATVLVVDDNRAVADTYAAFLDGEYAVRTAYGGEAALEALDASVDVVLLDRRMPDRSGDEVLAETNSRALDPRVVMLTAVDPDFEIAEIDVDDYVVKPVDMEQLRSVVERTLTISEYNDQRQRLSSLKLKRNVLEVEMDEHELVDSPKYQQLVGEIEALETEIEETEDALDLDQVDLYL